MSAALTLAAGMEQANPVASFLFAGDRRNARKGVGGASALLKGRAIPMGNHEPYWSTCIAKVGLTAERSEEMPDARSVQKKVAKCLVK